MITLLTFQLNRFQVGNGATAPAPRLPAVKTAPTMQSPNTLNLKSIHSDATLAADDGWPLATYLKYVEYHLTNAEAAGTCIHQCDFKTICTYR